jgi:hypothetical protein
MCRDVVGLKIAEGGQATVEIMKKHPIENGAFWMTRAVDSRHIGNEKSRNGPAIRAHQKIMGRT